MAMTDFERAAKDQIQTVLAKEGYPTYANLLNPFHINLTNDPNVVGYMEPGKGRIVLNRGLDIDQVSMVVRHEILHEYLTHMRRMEAHLGKDVWDKRTPQMHQASNIAGDYEISNRGYTDKDKRAARRIKLNGQELRGLVTEDDHPDWVDLSIEEMYDLLTKEMKKDQQMQPQIGNMGDQQIQDAEEIERQANDVSQSAGAQSQQSKDGEQGEGSDASSSDGQEGSQDGDQSGKSGGSSGSSESSKLDKLSKDADAVSDEAGEVADAIKDFKDSKGDNVFNTPEQRDAQEDLQERLKEIKRAFADVKTRERALSETDDAVYKDQKKKAERNAKKYANSPIQRFKESLAKFIKNEVEYNRTGSFKRFNKTYVNAGIIRRGYSMNPSNNIPSINVYFDRSGSWDAAKTAVGKEALGVLNNYVRRGEIKLRIYYFADDVQVDDFEGGGTKGLPILKHIQSTKPDNVIIMTDADIPHQDDEAEWDKTYVTVPGAVWFLWKGGQSPELAEHLHGRKENKQFDLT